MNFISTENSLFLLYEEEMYKPVLDGPSIVSRYHLRPILRDPGISLGIGYGRYSGIWLLYLGIAYGRYSEIWVSSYVSATANTPGSEYRT